MINEVLVNPAAVEDTVGEWFELYNTGASAVNINGWTIKDDGTQSHHIDNSGQPLWIQPGGYLVLGRNGDSQTNGGVTVDYVYGSVQFNNTSADELILLDGVTEKDRIDFKASWPFGNGKSMELSNPWAANNNDAGLWDQATTQWAQSSDYGTPGAANSNMVPEPTGLAMFGGGTVLLLLRRRRRPRRRRHAKT